MGHGKTTVLWEPDCGIFVRHFAWYLSCIINERHVDLRIEMILGSLEWVSRRLANFVNGKLVMRTCIMWSVPFFHNIGQAIFQNHPHGNIKRKFFMITYPAKVDKKKYTSVRLELVFLGFGIAIELVEISSHLRTISWYNPIQVLPRFSCTIAQPLPARMCSVSFPFQNYLQRIIKRNWYPKNCSHDISKMNLIANIVQSCRKNV